MISLGRDRNGNPSLWVVFPETLYEAKTKDAKYFLTWAQNGKPKDELSLSTSNDATIRSPDIFQVMIK